MPNHPELAKGTMISIMKQARLERKALTAARGAHVRGGPAGGGGGVRGNAANRAGKK